MYVIQEGYFQVYICFLGSHPSLVLGPAWDLGNREELYTLECFNCLPADLVAYSPETRQTVYTNLHSKLGSFSS